MIRVAVVALALIAAADPARADEPTIEAQAAQYFTAGKQAYDAGANLLAATAFEEAYRLSPLPEVVFAMAQAYRRHYYEDPQPRWLERARELYRQYLDEIPRSDYRAHAITHLATIDEILRQVGEQPDEPPPPPATQLMVSSFAPDAVGSIDGGELVEIPLVREVTPGTHVVRVEAPGHDPAESTWLAVEQRLVVAQVEPTPRPAVLELRSPSGARIVVDGQAISGSRTLRLPAGSHTVSVTARGHRGFATRVDLGFGEVRSLPTPLPATGQRRVARWMLAGAGAMLVAGGVTSALALDAQHDARAVQARLGPDRPFWSDDDRVEYNDEVSRRDGLRVASYALFGGVVALAATGAALYWLDRPSAEAPPPEGTPAVRPLLGPDTIGAVVTGSFE